MWHLPAQGKLLPEGTRTSDRAAIAKRSRCYSLTSSAFSSWVAFGYVARAARRTSSRWQRSHRTCAGSPGWSSGHRRQSLSVLPRQCRCHHPPGNPTPPHEGRPINHRFSESRKPPRHCYRRLLQQNRPEADINHYLAVAIDYPFRNRPQWSVSALVEKTPVSSAMIDRVAARLGRTLFKVPDGFKWFVVGR